MAVTDHILILGLIKLFYRASLSPFEFDHGDRITGLGLPRTDGFLGGMRPLATS